MSGRADLQCVCVSVSVCVSFVAVEKKYGGLCCGGIDDV